MKFNIGDLVYIHRDFKTIGIVLKVDKLADNQGYGYRIFNTNNNRISNYHESVVDQFYRRNQTEYSVFSGDTYTRIRREIRDLEESLEVEE